MLENNGVLTHVTSRHIGSPKSQEPELSIWVHQSKHTKKKTRFKWEVFTFAIGKRVVYGTTRQQWSHKATYLAQKIRVPHVRHAKLYIYFAVLSETKTNTEEKLNVFWTYSEEITYWFD